MTMTATSSDPPDDAVRPIEEAPVNVDEATEILITVQEVQLATAAAVGVPTRKPLWDWVTSLHLLAGPRRQRSKPVRRHYPSRNDFTEAARMSREMHRL